MLRPLLLATVLIVMLADAGCTGAGSTSTGAAGVPVESIRVTPATADDVLNAVRNGDSRVTLVNIWATWCGPCMEEMPDILEDRDLREDARCAVERIPGQEATDALIDALDFSTDNEFRLAVAHSLRVRGVEVDKKRYPPQKLIPTKQTKVVPVG